uniref:Uncharacterized protein n=1 Tax=Fagus sylvatica TaxID=28930 RepID=A0A2N9HZI7_FAGSY
MFSSFSDIRSQLSLSAVPDPVSALSLYRPKSGLSSLSLPPQIQTQRGVTRLVRSSNSVTADDITDGRDGDFTVEIAVEISLGIVLRSRLWMAVGPIGAWEIRRWRWRGEGGGTVLLRGGGFVGEEHECGSDGGRGRGRE